MMKKIATEKIVLLLLAIGSVCLFFVLLFPLSENKVPNYILKGYRLDDDTSSYRLQKEDKLYSLEVKTSQGKTAVFIVKPDPKLDQFDGKYVKVKGEYILEDTSVKVVVHEASLAE